MGESSMMGLEEQSMEVVSRMVPMEEDWVSGGLLCVMRTKEHISCRQASKEVDVNRSSPTQGHLMRVVSKG